MSRRRAFLSSRRKRALTAVTSAMLIVLSMSGTGYGQGDGGGQQRIEGPRWQLLEYRDETGMLRLVPPGISTTALLWFDVLTGEAACSSYRSTYNLVKDTLVIDQPEIASRGCDAEAQAIDDAFYRRLLETASWSTEGSVLELRDVVGETILTFTEAQLPDDPTIAPWQLARLADADGASAPVIAGSDPRVQFLRGGRLVGTTGCGWFLGSYTTNGTTISIGDIDSRQDVCTSELATQADAMLSTFGEITDFEVLPAGLTLEDADAVKRMALVPSIPLAGRTWTPVAALDEQGTSLVDQLRLRTSSVRFAGDEADGRTVCRSFKARSLRSGLALTVFDLEGEKARCRARAQRNQTISQQAVEDLFRDRLELAASHALRGTELELMDANGTPILRLRPQPPLRGVRWVLTQMDTAPNAARPRLRAPDGEQPIEAVFEEIEVVQGFSGKNGYVADYRTPGGSIMRITDIETTGRTCNRRRASNPLCVQERAYFDLLESVDGFVVAPEGLRLLRGSRAILFFEEAIDTDT